MIRILVVDDDPKLNQAACTYLNDCGYATCLATTTNLSLEVL